MKREIKFRGKKVDLGGTKDTSFVYGFLSNTEFINDKFGNGHCVDYKTIGQFTGLKDNNGVDIYEGDIVENGYSGIWIIQPLEYGSMSLLGVCEKYKGCNYDISALNASVEVMGNIHDNPELLSNE